MENSDDRIPYDLNDEENEIYKNLKTDTEKEEYLKKIRDEKGDQNVEDDSTNEAENTIDTENEAQNTIDTENEAQTDENEAIEESEIEIPPYPTYVQEQESNETNDWVKIPAVPFVIVFQKLYKCLRHPDLKGMNRGVFSIHLKSKHNLDLTGNTIINYPENVPDTEIINKNKNILQSSKSSSNEAQNNEKQLNEALETEKQLESSKSSSNEALKLTRDDIAYLEHQLNIRNATHEAEIEPETLVMATYNAEVAASATKIVQNIDLRFMYEKTKTSFPPDWDFATWITALVTFALNEFKIGATVWQDKDNLDEAKLKFLIDVKKDWEIRLLQEMKQQEDSIIAKSSTVL